MPQIVQGTKSEEADCVLLDAASPKENRRTEQTLSDKKISEKNLWLWKFHTTNKKLKGLKAGA